MAEGHREFTLSMCVCVYLFICVFQNLVRPMTSLCMVGFKNYFAQMTKTRQCIACKNHVARSEVTVTIGTSSLCVIELCLTHNFIMHGGI